MKKLKNIAILMGGKSSEHEISMISGRNIFENIDRTLYNTILIGIDINGRWVLIDQKDFIQSPNRYKTLKSDNTKKGISINLGSDQPFFDQDSNMSLGKIDVIFPVLHGSYGEDGSVQGLFRLVNIPYVGCDIVGSAINIDKEIMKKILKEAKIKSAKYIAFHINDRHKITFEYVSKKLGLPLILKPSSCGSSVGVHKVNSKDEFEKALSDTFLYDNKILFEEFVIGQEVECAVMGNNKIKATTPGEVITNKKYNFYDYEAKYMDPNGAEILIPAKLDVKITNKVRKHSIKAYKALYAQGLSRVDSFVKKDGTVLLNEINTLPGFTSISMFPKLWGYEGISYSVLIKKLIDLAIDRQKYYDRLKTTF